jgi:hypothetical protein
MLGDQPHQGKWRRASARHPCPICGKQDWCSLSSNGFIAICRRVELGAFKSEVDRSGVPVYIHRLAAGPPTNHEPSPKQSSSHTERANPDTLHQVYNALLAHLFLSKSHRADLQRRGLPDDAIDCNKYKTLPMQGRARIARKLHDVFGTFVLRVPGVVVKGDQGNGYVTIAGSAGLIIPCRDLHGRVIALKIRRDNASSGAKYVYLSSVHCGGPGPGSPVHVPLGISSAMDTVRLTEGELKADISMLLSGLPTISAPGALGWRASLPILNELRTRIVRLAFDADAGANPSLAKALMACADALLRDGFAIELEHWNMADGKGIDDLLAAGKMPELFRGDAALLAVRAFTEAARAIKAITPADSKLYDETTRRKGHSMIRFSVTLEI